MPPGTYSASGCPGSGLVAGEWAPPLPSGSSTACPTKGCGSARTAGTTAAAAVRSAVAVARTAVGRHAVTAIRTRPTGPTGGRHPSGDPGGPMAGPGRAEGPAGCRGRRGGGRAGHGRASCRLRLTWRDHQCRLRTGPPASAERSPFVPGGARPSAERLREASASHLCCLSVSKASHPDVHHVSGTAYPSP